MQVDFICGSLSRNGGGIFEITLALSHCLTQRRNIVKVLGHRDEFWPEDKDRWLPVDAKALPTKRFLGYNWSSQLTQEILDSTSQILHLHGLWTHGSIAVSNAYRRTKKPYVISPHGMLEPWALNNSKWKKRLAWWAFENNLLKNCSCIHANTHKELNDIRKLKIRVPVAIIPNGVFSPPERLGDTDSSLHTLLYLGRLHPKKGLSNLIRAWAMPESRNQLRNWRLAIAGWDQENHTEELKSIARSNNLRYWENKSNTEPSVRNCPIEKNDIVFLGPLFENAKHEWLSTANAFILPSHSEGLPMSVLEAWAYKLPCLITPECNLPEGKECQAAISIEGTTSGIAMGLTTLGKMTREEMSEMGQKGYELVSHKFTWTSVAENFQNLYMWLAGQSSKPDFVYS